MRYDYQCEKCNSVYEVIQSMKDDAVSTCPQCNSTCRNRLVSGGAGFVLRGGGWYSDAYTTGNKKNTE